MVAKRKPPTSGAALHAVDDALVRLRRLWSPGRAAAVAPDGTPVEMSSLLVVESVARREQDGTTASVGDVAAFCDVEASTASRLVDRAVRAGLVTRAPSREDTRRAALTLTDAGRGVRDAAVAVRTGWLTGVLADWDAADVEAFAATLTRFAAAVEAAPGMRTPGP